MVAVLCFLACLAAIGALAADRAADGWTDQLIGSATVAGARRAAESADAAAARAAEALAGVTGVAEARALEKAKAEALVARWLGPVRCRGPAGAAPGGGRARPQRTRPPPPTCAAP